MTVYERLIMRVRAVGFSLLRALALPVLGLVLACGSSPPAEDPAAVESSESATAAASEAEPEEDVPDAEPVRPSCSDGTCFECGSGLCPQGAYCDASAPGGPACAWIQECPGSPSCACLAKVLGAACSCDASAGSPHVTCR